MCFKNKEIEICYNQYRKLLEKWRSFAVKIESADIVLRSQLVKERDVAKKECMDYFINIYAKAIFNAYEKDKPILINKETGKKCKWQNLFPSCFEKVDVMRRHILVGLIEGNGSYKFE